MYKFLVNNGIRVSKIVWKLKILLKIKIFLWFFKKEVFFIKDNLSKRNWNGDTSCCFCSELETIQHLFLESTYAKFLLRAVHMVLGISPPKTYTKLI